MYANTGVGSLSIAVQLQTNKTQTLSIISSDYLSPIRIGKVISSDYLSPIRIGKSKNVCTILFLLLVFLLAINCCSLFRSMFSYQV